MINTKGFGEWQMLEPAAGEFQEVLHELQDQNHFNHRVP